MNIGIYNPYLDSFGGGEKYFSYIANSLMQSHTVSFFWHDPHIVSHLEKKFDIPLTSVKVYENFWKGKNTFEKLNKSRNFDVVIFLSDGSIPVSFSKKTFIMFQHPVPWVYGKNALIQFKIKRIDGIFVNSQFTKSSIDVTFKVHSRLIYPPVNTSQFHVGKKQNVILSVGRFTKDQNMKKQELLIDVFKTLQSKELRGFKLVLVGSVLDKDKSYVQELESKASGSNIEIISNSSQNKLVTLYSSAKLYWHAAGYGEDLDKHPERAEHFGMSVVEAMASGAVPVVFDGGGIPEIVSEKKEGFLWVRKEELVTKTIQLVTNEKLYKTLQSQGLKKAKIFDVNIFTKQIQEFIQS